MRLNDGVCRTGLLSAQQMAKQLCGGGNGRSGTVSQGEILKIALCLGPKMAK